MKKLYSNTGRFLCTASTNREAKSLKRQGTMEILYEELEIKKNALFETPHDKTFVETRVAYSKQIRLLERLIERIKALDEL